MPDGITFAGVPALLDVDDRVRAFFEQRWPPSAWPFASNKTDRQPLANPFFQKNRAGIFTSPYPDCPAPKINELIIPSNAGRYAKALIIVDKKSLEDIPFTADPIEGKWWNLEKSLLEFNYQGDAPGNLQRVLWNMYALTPIRCDPTINANLWMVPLVDERYFWNRAAGDGLMSFYADTWDDLIQNIAGVLGFESFTVLGDIAEAYGVPDQESLLDADTSLGSLLDTIALSIGKRFVYQGMQVFGGTGGIFRSAPDPAGFGTVQRIAERLENAGKLIHGGKQLSTETFDPVVAVARKAFDYWGNSDELDFNVPDRERVASANTIRCAWWLEHFTDAYTGLPEVDPDSQAALDEFRAQLQTDLEAWRDYPFAFTLEGVYSHEDSGHVDYHSYSCERLRNGNMSLTTKIVGLPHGFCPYVNIAQRPNVYVHPHDTADFEITEYNIGSLNAGRIIQAFGPYSVDFDAELDPIPLRTHSSVHNVGQRITCHYHQGHGWKEIITSSTRMFARISDEWTKGRDAYYQLARPLDYSNPLDWFESVDQGSGEAEDHLIPIHFVPKTTVGKDDPNDIDFPDWLHCYLDPASNKWIVLYWCCDEASSSSESSESSSVSSSRESSSISSVSSVSSVSISESSSLSDSSRSSQSKSSRDSSRSSESSVSESSESEPSESQSSRSFSFSEKSSRASSQSSVSESDASSSDSSGSSESSESSASKSSRSESSQSRSDSDSRSDSKSDSDSVSKSQSESESQSESQSESRSKSGSDSQSDPSQSQSDESESEKSKSDKSDYSDQSQSDKSNAIVPASWTAGGYAALFVEESPEVVFHDTMLIKMTGIETTIAIDPHFVEVCEPGTIHVSGAVPDEPVLIGAKTVDGNAVRIKLGRECEDLRVVVTLTAIRKGFMNKRFPSRNYKQFAANERHIRSAYPGAGE